MKLSKKKLKQLIREELSFMKEEQPGLKSGVGKALAHKIANAPGVENLLLQLKEKDQVQRAEFVAHFAQLLDVNLTDRDMTVTRTAQKRMQKAATLEEPQGA